MRKYLLFVAFSVFAFSASQSQELRFGAKLGLNVAFLGGDTGGLESLGSREAFHIGGLIEIPLSEKFSIQPEVLYSQEGADWVWGVGDGESKLDYIRIPVLAKYYFIKGLSAELGPSFGFLMSAESRNIDIKEELNSFDTGLAFGASYRLDMGVFFSMRFTKGLMDISKNSVISNQSNVFQISAGYSF